MQRLERELQCRDQRNTEQQEAEEAALELQKQVMCLPPPPTKRAACLVPWRVQGAFVLGEQTTNTAGHEECLWLSRMHTISSGIF